jgi:hypothetical protein
MLRGLLVCGFRLRGLFSEDYVRANKRQQLAVGTVIVCVLGTH